MNFFIYLYFFTIDDVIQLPIILKLPIKYVLNKLNDFMKNFFNLINFIRQLQDQILTVLN